MREDEKLTSFQIEQNFNARYIASANPTMILEMIEEIKDLQSIVLAYEAGCNTVGCLRTKEIEEIKKKQSI